MSRFSVDTSTSQLIPEPEIRVLGETCHTARSSQTCSICLRPIIVGDRYARRVFTEAGVLQTRVFHLASRSRPACHTLLEHEEAA